MPIANANDPDDVHNQALGLIEAAYRHEDVGQPPVLIGDVNYWITGENPDLIPGDYFDEGAYASMLAFQQTKIEAHTTRTQR